LPNKRAYFTINVTPSSTRRAKCSIHKNITSTRIYFPEMVPNKAKLLQQLFQVSLPL
jgi:hypothetical protein